MKRTYQIDGMTCSSCQQKVREALMQVEDLQDVESTAFLQDDDGEVEAMCCGPNEPPPPPGDDQ